MSRQPWMKFYPADWRSEVTLRCVSREARSLWVDILCLIHEGGDGRLHIGGANPTDKMLASVLGDNPRTIRKLLVELEGAEVFSRDDHGFIISRRIIRDLEKAEKDKSNGRMGGNPSLKNNDLGGKGVNPPDKAQKLEARSQRLEDITPVPPSGEAAPTKTEPRKSPSRGSRIPDNWQVGPDERAAAQSAGLPADRVAIEGEKFRDYWRAKTGQGATKADWPATWRNWCRRAAENIGRFPPKPPDKPGNRGGFATILQENMDDLLRNINDEQPQHYPDDDWRAEPEIMPPGGSDPRGFSAGGQDLRRDENRADGLSNVFDFRQARAYG